MPDQVAQEFDDVEQELIACAERLADQAATEQWQGRRRWTQPLLSAFGQRGKARGYYVCGTHSREHGQRGWLYDLVWLKNHDGFVVDVPLILESELSSNYKDIADDFEKLLVGRAQHRAMVFRHKDVKGVCDRLTEEVRRFGWTQPGDRYLFLGLSGRVFKPKLLIA